MSPPRNAYSVYYSFFCPKPYTQAVQSYILSRLYSVLEAFWRRARIANRAIATVEPTYWVLLIVLAYMRCWELRSTAITDNVPRRLWWVESSGRRGQSLTGGTEDRFQSGRWGWQTAPQISSSANTNLFTYLLFSLLLIFSGLHDLHKLSQCSHFCCNTEL